VGARRPRRALDQLRTLADELARSHPGGAASLREGMQETADRHASRRAWPAQAHAGLDEPVRRGDKYMADAYPPDGPPGATTHAKER